jgi:hypothetical protein
MTTDSNGQLQKVSESLSGAGEAAVSSGTESDTDKANRSATGPAFRRNVRHHFVGAQPLASFSASAICAVVIMVDM